jgi:hypothetical protein
MAQSSGLLCFAKAHARPVQSGIFVYKYVYKIGAPKRAKFFYTHLWRLAAMQKITHTYLVSLKATGETQNIACGEGLSLRVSPKGKKSWYLRYDTIAADGKRKQNVVSLGNFPRLGLKEAHAEADERKSLAKHQNANLAKAKKEEQLAKAQIKKIPTFQEIADGWLSLKTAEWENRSAKQNRGRLVANVYPVIGHLPVNEITVADVEQALKFIIDRGSLEVARHLRPYPQCAAVTE